MTKIDSDRHIENAGFFSPLGFFHKNIKDLGRTYVEDLARDEAAGNLKLISDADGRSVLAYRALAWDSGYFGVPTFRIDFASSLDSGAEAVKGLAEALSVLLEELRRQHESFYIFGELPSEAILPIQALGNSGWRMLETRLSYFREHLGDYEYARRFPVRRATESDIEGLRHTAINSRNMFDRFHADSYYSPEIADKFLATFVENSVKGFADITLVPDSDQMPPDAFLTANFVPDHEVLPGKKIGKMILSAVGESRRGWYVKLISEMSYLFKEQGVDVAYMTTQSTNKAVIKTWEKLGYSLGRCSHVFVFSQGDLR